MGAWEAAEIEELLEVVDGDGDGQIDYKELRAGLERYEEEQKEERLAEEVEEERAAERVADRVRMEEKAEQEEWEARVRAGPGELVLVLSWMCGRGCGGVTLEPVVLAPTVVVAPPLPLRRRRDRTLRDNDKNSEREGEGPDLEHDHLEHDHQQGGNGIGNGGDAFSWYGGRMHSGSSTEVVDLDQSVSSTGAVRILYPAADDSAAAGYATIVVDLAETEDGWYRIVATATGEHGGHQRSDHSEGAHGADPYTSDQSYGVRCTRATMQIVRTQRYRGRAAGVVAEMAVPAQSTPSLPETFQHWDCCAVHGSTGEVRILNRIVRECPIREAGISLEAPLTTPATATTDEVESGGSEGEYEHGDGDTSAAAEMLGLGQRK